MKDSFRSKKFFYNHLDSDKNGEIIGFILIFYVNRRRKQHKKRYPAKKRVSFFHF